VRLTVLDHGIATTAVNFHTGPKIAEFGVIFNVAQIWARWKCSKISELCNKLLQQRWSPSRRLVKLLFFIINTSLSSGAEDGHQIDVLWRFGRRRSFIYWPRNLAHPCLIFTGVGEGKMCEIWRDFLYQWTLSRPLWNAAR